MRYLTLALILVMGASASADDDIKAFVESQVNPTPESVSQDTRIKEFARYQRERLRTYSDAVDQHDKTKQTVIVWVGFLDDDELFQLWKATKDVGYHVFVKEFPDVKRGVVVGRDFGGSFGRLPTITDDYVKKITENATVKFSPAPAQTPFGAVCLPGKP